MDDFDPLALSQALRRTAQSWRTWRRQLKSAGSSELDPFFRTRSACGRTAFQEISALNPEHPLRAPLLRWIFRLAEQRINAPLLEHIAQRYWHVEQPSESSASGLATSRAQLLASLRQGPRAAWLKELFASSTELGVAVATLWERRREVAQRMGGDAQAGLEWPGGAADVAKLALDWIEQTQPLAEDSLLPEWQQRLDEALGGAALSGWPARLNPRALLDLLHAAELFRGLELDPGPLPELIAPASFMRALTRVGASFSDAAATHALPFVVAHDPYGLRRASLGALFGLLPWLEAFAKRQLGLGGSALANQRRALAKVILIESRQAAARVLLRQAALDGATELRRVHAELSERLLGRSLPASAAGVYWRPRNDSLQRFAGLLLAARQARSFTEEHNEDWFRNPRAHEQLRSEAELPPVATASTPELALGANTLFTELCATLG